MRGHSKFCSLRASRGLQGGSQLRRQRHRSEGPVSAPLNRRLLPECNRNDGGFGLHPCWAVVVPALQVTLVVVRVAGRDNPVDAFGAAPNVDVRPERCVLPAAEDLAATWPRHSRVSTPSVLPVRLVKTRVLHIGDMDLDPLHILPLTRRSPMEIFDDSRLGCLPPLPSSSFTYWRLFQLIRRSTSSPFALASLRAHGLELCLGHSLEVCWFFVVKKPLAVIAPRTRRLIVVTAIHKPSCLRELSHRMRGYNISRGCVDKKCDAVLP
jgi:hypothetical protein